MTDTIFNPSVKSTPLPHAVKAAMMACFAGAMAMVPLLAPTSNALTEANKLCAANPNCSAMTPDDQGVVFRLGSGADAKFVRCRDDGDCVQRSARGGAA